MGKISTDFKLSDNFIEKYKDKKPPFGYNGLGELVYVRTYSRIKKDGKNEQWWETIRRVVEGIYNIQKEHIDHGNLGWNAMKAQKSAQEMYDLIFNIKFLPSGRALWALGSDVITEKKLSEALYNCFGGEELFLTKNGYIKFSEANKEENILTVNGQWVKSEIKNFGKQKIVELHLSRAGNKKIIKTTEDHLWFANYEWNIKRKHGYQLLKTSELKEGMRLKYQFANTSSSVRIPSPQGIQHGFMFGDGTKNRIDLQKGKDESIIKYFGENRIFEKDGFYQITDLPEHYKELPMKRWDKKYILGFLMGYFAAEGSINNGEISISSSKKENLEFYKEMAETCGIGSYAIRMSSNSSNYKEDRELYQMTLIPSTLWKDFFILEKHINSFDIDKNLYYWTVEKMVNTNIEEDVYCAVVSEKECFVLTDGILTHNCTFISTENLKDDVSMPFKYAMDMLMCGVGVGFDIRGAKTVTIKKRSEKIEEYLIPDTREGWVESVGKVIMSFFGQPTPILDYSIIRPQGEPIKTFGGVASGSKPLEELHLSIIDILSSHEGEEISQRIIVDIFNLIGKAVIAGNVRRSAEIALGFNDEEFLNLKNYNINKERESFGWASNNSVFADIGMDYKNISERIKDNAEPGLVWLSNAQKFGRMNENECNNTDFRIMGFNPCFSYESLLLTENGYKEIGSLDGKTVNIIDAEGNVQEAKIFKTGQKNTISLNLSNKQKIICTPDHVLKTLDGDFEAKDTFGKQLYPFLKNRKLLCEKEINDLLSKAPYVQSINNNGEIDVYDFSIPNLHWGVINGFVVHNCGEIGLESAELCNLVEIFPYRNGSKEEFLRTLKYAYLFAKSITLIETSWVESNRVMMRNRRLGISVTGIAQFISNRSVNDLKDWLETGYNTVKNYDNIYSEWFAIPKSIKLTTTKPSGTLSLLGGATPGLHYPESTYYIRRVRLANNSPLIKVLTKAKYKIEPAIGQEDSTVVIEFPIFVGENVRTLENVSMWEQLALASFLQKYWSDNAVSVTVSFDPETEGKDLERALDFYQYQLKGVSFLPKLKNGSYAQMPYEKIDKETYEEMVSKLKPLDFSCMRESEEAEVEKYCSNDGCSLF